MDTADSNPKTLCPQPKEPVEKSIAQSPQSQGNKDHSTPQTPLEEELSALDTRTALIQALIPLGCRCRGRELQEEVTR